MRSFLYMSALLALAACSVDPSKTRVYDADETFKKMESPDVPTIEQSLERAAIDFLKKGENGRALSLYQQLYDKQPKEVRYILGFAESLRRVGEYEKAIEFYNRIIERHPGHLDAHEGKALAVMSSGEIEEASKLFGLIMKRDSKRWRTLNALGVMFAAKNMPEEAIAYLSEAQKYSEDNPSIYNNIGLVQAIARKYRDAVASLKRAIKKADSMQREQVEMNLALVYGISGNMDEARHIAERHVSGAALENNLGLYAHLINNGELAKSYLNMALSGSAHHYERAWENLDIITSGAKVHNSDEGYKSYVIE